MEHRTQCEMVLAYMQEHGRIDDTAARGVFGIKRLASRVNDLRQAGVDIETRMISGVNRFGVKVSWGEYVPGNGWGGGVLDKGGA